MGVHKDLQLLCKPSCPTTEGLGQTGSSVLSFVEMNLLAQNHNHYTTAKAIYSVTQEREIEGMLR